MLLLCCFSWEETFGWLSTAYVRLSANTSFQSSASCCHSSRCAHQLNPLSCGWAGWQVSGQHLSLQLSVFPSVPALPHSTDLTSTLSTLSPPLTSMWRLNSSWCIWPSASEVHRSFLLLFFLTLLHVEVSSPDHLLLCPYVCVNLNHTNHRRVIIIIAPFLVVPFPAARASCSTNAPLRLPASFLPSSGNNSHESQHDTALGWKFTAFPSSCCGCNHPGRAVAPSRLPPVFLNRAAWEKRKLWKT